MSAEQPKDEKPSRQGRLLHLAAEVFAEKDLPSEWKPKNAPPVTETVHESDGLVTLVNGCCDTSDMSDHDERTNDLGDNDPLDEP